MKIRVAFIINNADWSGGINYFKNLILALQSEKNHSIEPVIITHRKVNTGWFLEHNIEVICTPLVDEKSTFYIPSLMCREFFNYQDYPLYFYLRKQKIDVLSHYNGFIRGGKIKYLAWIPDFQHFHLPYFFTARQKYARTRLYKHVSQSADALILSSEAAKWDLQTFLKPASVPVFVLPFFSSIQTEANHITEAQIRTKFNLPLQWFYLPNQFWAHKNHGIVIDALNLLKKQGVHPTIVCTGTTADHRSPHYFGQIQKKIADYHLQDQFIILGLIPYAEVAALAKYSLAMINPSFFEGWSTSVEEAKSLGKRIILSHLPVHLEQAPQKAHYFDPKNAKELAEIMLQVIKIDQDKTESENGFSQENILQARKAFATNYLKIISQITRAT